MSGFGPFGQSSKGTQFPYPSSEQEAFGQQVARSVEVLDAYAVDQWATDPETTGGLVYGYRGGVAFNGTAYIRVAAGTVTLTPSATNYVERDTAGAVSVNTVGFSATRLPMAKVTTDAGGIVDIEDNRVFPASGSGGGGGMEAHLLVGPLHTASGLTPGHFLKALSPTTFGFAAHGLTYGDVGAAAASHAHGQADILDWPLSVARGGTGISSYSVGDLLYASAPTTLARLPDVAPGAVLVSGGVGTAPAWSTTPTIAGLLTLQAGASIAGGQAVLWTADNVVGSTIGTSGAGRPYGGYFGTEVVVGSDYRTTYGLTTTAMVSVQGGGVVAFLPDATVDAFVAWKWSDDPTLGRIAFIANRGRGTVTAPLALVDGDIIGRYTWQGAGTDGALSVSAAAVLEVRARSLLASGIWTNANQRAGDVALFSRADDFSGSSGTTTPTWRADRWGNFLVNRATATLSGLYLGILVASPDIATGARTIANLFSRADADAETWSGNITGLNATVTQSSDVAWHGTYSVKVVATSASSGRGLLMPAIAATAGRTYAFSAVVRGAAGSETVRASLVFKDAGGATLQTDTGRTCELSASEWRRISMKAVAPASTATVVCRVLTATAQAATWYTDGLILQEYSTAPSDDYDVASAWVPGGETVVPGDVEVLGTLYTDRISPAYAGGTLALTRGHFAPLSDNVSDFGVSAARWRTGYAYTFDAATGFSKSGTQVVGARQTGWATSGWTVSQSRAAFDPATVSLGTLAQVVQALIADLGAASGKHGLLNAVVAP